jgi:hypothetical protein
VPYFTNETIFENARPSISSSLKRSHRRELAQAYQRLGSDVTVIEAFEPLAKTTLNLRQSYSIACVLMA